MGSMRGLTIPARRSTTKKEPLQGSMRGPTTSVLRNIFQLTSHRVTLTLALHRAQRFPLSPDMSLDMPNVH